MRAMGLPMQRRSRPIRPPRGRRNARTVVVAAAVLSLGVMMWLSLRAGSESSSTQLRDQAGPAPGRGVEPLGRQDVPATVAGGSVHGTPTPGLETDGAALFGAPSGAQRAAAAEWPDTPSADTPAAGASAQAQLRAASPDAGGDTMGVPRVSAPSTPVETSAGIERNVATAPEDPSQWPMQPGAPAATAAAPRASNTGAVVAGGQSPAPASLAGPRMTPEERKAEVNRQKAVAAAIWEEAVQAVRPVAQAAGTRRQRIARGRKLPADFTRLPARVDWPDCSVAERPVRRPMADGSLEPRRYYVYDTARPPVFRMTVAELSARGWQRVDKRSMCSAEYIFTNGQRRIGWAKLGRWHVTNHIFQERMVADKSTLADRLARSKEEGVLTPFWPETYWMRDVIDRAIFKRVLAANPTPQPPFLVKDPTQHRGRGVRFLENKDVPTVISRITRVSADEDRFGHSIYQRYVPNPLLLPPHSRKFDLRVYWLIASTNPVRVYYHDGTTRSSLESFNPDNTEDMGQHLTNVAVQKQNKALYAESKEELRLSFDQLALVLQEAFPDHPDPIEDVRAQIRHALSVVFLAGKDELSETRFTEKAFSLLGGDFIIDDDLHVWLLEIQEGPVRSTMTDATLQLWLDMTSEQIDILMEIEENLAQGGPAAVPRNLRSCRNFQLIVDDNGEVPRPLDHLPVAKSILNPEANVH